MPGIGPAARVANNENDDDDDDDDKSEAKRPFGRLRFRRGRQKSAPEFSLTPNEGRLRDYWRRHLDESDDLYKTGMVGDVPIFYVLDETKHNTKASQKKQGGNETLNFNPACDRQQGALVCFLREARCGWKGSNKNGKKQGGFGETLLNGNFHGWVSAHFVGWFKATGMFGHFGRVNPKILGTKFNRVKPVLDKAVSYG